MLGQAFLHQWSDSLTFAALGWHLALLGNPLLVAGLQSLVYLAQGLRVLSAGWVEAIGPRSSFGVGLWVGGLALAGIGLAFLDEPVSHTLVLLLAGLFLAANGLVVNAWSTYLPRRCPATLKRANARVRIAETLGDLLGDVLGPIVYAATHFLPFFLGAVGRFAAIALTDRLHAVDRVQGRVGVGLRNALHVLMGDPALRISLSLGALAQAALALVFGVLPFWARTSGTPAFLYGFLLAAFTLGLLFGNAHAATGDTRNHIRRALLLLFGSITLMLFQHPAPGLLGLLGLGTGTSALGLQFAYIRQSRSPKGGVAQVSALSALTSTVVGALFSMLAGVLAKITVLLPLLAGLGLLVMASEFARSMPDVDMDAP